MRLQGKVAVVTGGGSGIGEGIAMCMAREGADVAIPDIQDGNAQHVAREVQKLGRKAIAMPFTNNSEEDWDRTYAVNLKSVFLTCKALAPYFIERRAGRIINIASIAGPLAALTMPPYSVAKGGVITFTRVIAKELAPHGVTVNAICPGVLWTAFWQGLAKYIGDTNPAFKGMTPREVFDKRVA